MQTDDHDPKNHPSSEAISGVVRNVGSRAGAKLLLLAWKSCPIGDGLTQDLGVNISGGASWVDFRV